MSNYQYNKYREGLIKRHITCSGRYLSEIWLKEFEPLNDKDTLLINKRVFKTPEIVDEKSNEILQESVERTYIPWISEDGVIYGGGDNPLLRGGIAMASFAIEYMLEKDLSSLTCAEKLLEYFERCELRQTGFFQRCRNILYTEEIGLHASADELSGLILGLYYLFLATENDQKKIINNRAKKMVHRIANHLKKHGYLLLSPDSHEFHRGATGPYFFQYAFERAFLRITGLEFSPSEDDYNNAARKLIVIINSPEQYIKYTEIDDAILEITAVISLWIKVGHITDQNTIKQGIKAISTAIDNHNIILDESHKNDFIIRLLELIGINEYKLTSLIQVIFDFILDISITIGGLTTQIKDLRLSHIRYLMCSQAFQIQINQNVTPSGWRYEGIACYVSKKRLQGHVPLYRAWNGKDHFYTISEREYNGLPTSYKREGIECYVERPPQVGQKHKPLYRFYHTKKDDHIYTTGENEKSNLEKDSVWKSEGVAGYASASRIDDHVPLYRAYNDKIVDHFYTTDLNEINRATGWRYEGIACHVSKKSLQGHLPLYRAWNGKDHFYTISKREYDGLPSSYKREGIACYIESAPQSETKHKPLYRFYHTKKDDHIYTTSENEKNNLEKDNVWRSEGIACFVSKTQIADHVPLYRAYNSNIVDHFYTTNWKFNRIDNWFNFTMYLHTIHYAFDDRMMTFNPMDKLIATLAYSTIKEFINNEGNDFYAAVIARGKLSKYLIYDDSDYIPSLDAIIRKRRRMWDNLPVGELKLVRDGDPRCNAPKVRWHNSNDASEAKIGMDFCWEKNNDAYRILSWGDSLHDTATGLDVKIIGYKLKNGYLFSWDDIPGNDNSKLIEVLKQDFYIDWATTAKIEKIDNGNTIKVTNQNDSISLKLNDKQTEVNLEIDDVRTDKYFVKIENSKLNIYKNGIDVMLEAGGLDYTFPYVLMGLWLNHNIKIYETELNFLKGKVCLPFQLDNQKKLKAIGCKFDYKADLSWWKDLLVNYFYLDMRIN